ncbi:MAG: eL32 family ribosomal protein [Nanoarchaeota archaeon]
MTTFLRRSHNRFSKLGLRRKKKQVWRSPKGRHNKMRKKRKGYPAVVSVGYSTDKKIKGKINDKTPVVINNMKELEGLKNDRVVLIGKIGKKKKLEIVKKLKEMKISMLNLNVNRFLKKNGGNEK